MEFPKSYYFEIIEAPQVLHRQSPHTRFHLPVKVEAGKERIRQMVESSSLLAATSNDETSFALGLAVVRSIPTRKRRRPQGR